MKLRFAVMSLILLSTVASCASNRAQRAPLASSSEGWVQVTAPTQGPTRVVGEYAAGCLAGAKPLARVSQSYILMRASRDAFYGTLELLEYVENLGKSVRKNLNAFILVEDLSRPRGGPYVSGHGSHQIGLDVDISLTLSSKKMSESERETFSSPSFVEDRRRLKSAWGPQQDKLVSLAAANESVDRIFVSPAIKMHFCEKFAGAPWLYKLRAWWGHEEHLHVRLKCPGGQPSCVSQPPLNPKDPCGDDQKWWLSPEADAEWKSMQTEWTKGTSSKPARPLPSACEAIRTAE